MSDRNGVDLSAPLSRLWRDVYRKAAQVAEGRTTEQLKSHVYVYHPNGAGGGGGGEVDDLYVNETGDTMTGTLYMTGDEITAQGGLVLSGPDVSATAGQLLGPSSPALPTLGSQTLVQRVGLRFTVSEATTVQSVSWYRSTTAAPYGNAPDAVELWDVPTATAVWTYSGAAMADLDDPALGWKTAPLPAADRPAPLTPFREYVLCWYWTVLANRNRADAYTPVPTGPITFVANNYTEGGPPPFAPSAHYYLLDFAVGGDPVPSPPADAGAIRLPHAADLAWRDEANTHNNTLSFDADDRLLVNGVPLGGAGSGVGNAVMHTQTGAPAGATNSLWFNPSESA